MDNMESLDKPLKLTEEIPKVVNKLSSNMSSRNEVVLAKAFSEIPVILKFQM